MRTRILAIFLICPIMASAQVATPLVSDTSMRIAPVGFTGGHAASSEQPKFAGRQARSSDSGRVPRWIKWGTVGALAGGALFAIAGQSGVDDQPHSVAGDFAFGAGTGFVLVGGGVLFYDWVCSSGSRSRAAGLCGR